MVGVNVGLVLVAREAAADAFLSKIGPGGIDERRLGVGPSFKEVGWWARDA